MTTRQGRPSQVRPRPPSSGRPAPSKVRARPPAPGRLAAHRRVENTRRLAMPFRLLFVAAIVSLGAGVLFAASGGVGRVADALGATLTGFVDDLTATPVPSELPPELADAPVLQQPEEPYTNEAKVDLVGTIPEDAAGTNGNRIRIYVAIGDQDPGIVTELPVGQDGPIHRPRGQPRRGLQRLHRDDRLERRRVRAVVGGHVRLRRLDPADRHERAEERRRRQRQDRLDRGRDPAAQRSPGLERDVEPDRDRRRRRERRVRDRPADRRGAERHRHHGRSIRPAT